MYMSTDIIQNIVPKYAHWECECVRYRPHVISDISCSNASDIIRPS